LVPLEKAKNKLLETKEEEWCFKNNTLWLKNGYGNTKLFQAYAKGKKMANTIWCLKDENGREHSSFEDLTQLGTNHFKNLFKAYKRVSVNAIV